jgi:ribonuclease R
MYVEGLVHITELGGEYYRFDEARRSLRGERTGLRYALGSRVRVQVSRVDLDGRRIDFRLVQEMDALQPRSGKDTVRDGVERKLLEHEAEELPTRRRGPKLSEPQVRAAKPKRAEIKSSAAPAVAKPKDKGRKARRRS